MSDEEDIEKNYKIFFNKEEKEINISTIDPITVLPMSKLNLNNSCFLLCLNESFGEMNVYRDKEEKGYFVCVSKKILKKLYEDLKKYIKKEKHIYDCEDLKLIQDKESNISIKIYNKNNIEQISKIINEEIKTNDNHYDFDIIEIDFKNRRVDIIDSRYHYKKTEEDKKITPYRFNFDDDNLDLIIIKDKHINDNI